MKIKKGDKVKVLLGKDRGKTGTVDQVFGKQGTALVANLNVYKKHQKPRGEGRQKTGGIISVGRPLALAKLSLVCPKCGQNTRVGFRLSGSEKSRICRKCQAEI